MMTLMGLVGSRGLGKMYKKSGNNKQGKKRRNVTMPFLLLGLFDYIIRIMYIIRYHV